MPERAPEDIRSSIEVTRQELTYSLGDLRSKVRELTDYRRQIRENQAAIVAGAAATGFLVGGGVAAVIGLFRRG